MKRFINTYLKMLPLLMTLMLTSMLGLWGCSHNNKKTVTSIENVTLTLREMRGVMVYEVTEENGKTSIIRYRERYSGGENLLEAEASAVCDTESFVALMNTCAVMSWNGFHGKHPKNVKDGTMFTFTASVNGGERISADGSARFPKGYRDFVRALNDMLASGEN